MPRIIKWEGGPTYVRGQEEGEEGSAKSPVAKRRRHRSQWFYI